MNAGLDADQPTRAMTPEQIKEDAARLRALNFDLPLDAAEGLSLDRVLDLLDSLTVETRVINRPTPRTDRHFMQTRLVSTWSDWQPTNKEAPHGE